MYVTTTDGCRATIVIAAAEANTAEDAETILEQDGWRIEDDITIRPGFGPYVWAAQVMQRRCMTTPRCADHQDLDIGDDADRWYDHDR